MKSWAKEYQRQWYLRNKEKQIARNAKHKKRYVARNHQFIRQYKLEHPCTKCGENHPACLDFHHERDKSDNVGTLVVMACSIETIKKEIAKCIVLCRNCHAKLHYEERAFSSVG